MRFDETYASTLTKELQRLAKSLIPDAEKMDFLSQRLQTLDMQNKCTRCSLSKHTSIKKKPSKIPAASSLWKKVDNVSTLCKFALSIPS